MKPKTLLQKRVAELFPTLPPLTEKQREWAIRRCFEKDGLRRKQKVWCLNCGAEFPHDATKGKTPILCPECREKINLVESRKTTYKESWYFTIMTVCKEFQVCRNFLASKYVRVGEKPYYEIDEAVQNWITAEGKETIVARATEPVSKYYDLWIFSKPMEIRVKRQSYGYYHMDKYVIDSKYIAPGQKILPILKRNGYQCKQYKTPLVRMVKSLLADPIAEMLIKTKQYSLFERHCNGYSVSRYVGSIRIANRNGYQINDAQIWVDYLELLEWFGKDLRNAKYVCPANLTKAHDLLVKKKQQIEKAEALKKKRKLIAEREAEYKKAKGKYFGICFGGNGIMVTVIKSVAEMAEEGDAMHHCVFANEYYRKPDSLILSAKNSEGERLETVEVNLKTFSIVQSRGVCNKFTEQHQAIINLVDQNINLIKRTHGAGIVRV